MARVDEGATRAEGDRMETRHPTMLFHYFDLRYANTFLVKNFFSNMMVTKLKEFALSQNSNNTTYILLPWSFIKGRKP